MADTRLARRVENYLRFLGHQDDYWNITVKSKNSTMRTNGPSPLLLRCTEKDPSSFRALVAAEPFFGQPAREEFWDVVVFHAVSITSPFGLLDSEGITCISLCLALLEHAGRNTGSDSPCRHIRLSRIFRATWSPACPKSQDQVFKQTKANSGFRLLPEIFVRTGMFLSEFDIGLSEDGAHVLPCQLELRKTTTHLFDRSLENGTDNAVFLSAIMLSPYIASIDFFTLIEDSEGYWDEVRAKHVGMQRLAYPLLSNPCLLWVVELLEDFDISSSVLNFGSEHTRIFPDTAWQYLAASVASAPSFTFCRRSALVKAIANAENTPRYPILCRLGAASGLYTRYTRQWYGLFFR